LGLCLCTCSISIKTKTKKEHSQPAVLHCACRRLSCALPPGCRHVIVMSLSLSSCHGQRASSSSSSSGRHSLPHRHVISSWCTLSSSCHVVPGCRVVSCRRRCIRRCRYTLRRLALSLWHLLSPRGGPSSPSLFPSCLSTRQRWDPYTFVSFDMSVLGSLHLRVLRHVGVGILTPSCLSTRRCWVLIPFGCSLSKVIETGPHPS